MSLNDHNVLAVLYDGLATPPMSPTSSKYPRSRSTFNTPLHTPRPSQPPTPLNRSPTKPTPALPDQLLVDTLLDSLTREKKGKMPELSHLLSVGDGRVLSLAADDKYVYAGCQSQDNEINVSDSQC